MGYPDYFISVGINSEGDIELQVLAIPPQNSALHGINENSRGSHHNTKEDPTFVLLSIPIHPGGTLAKWDITTWICHEYTGRTINTIRLWIGDDAFGGSYSIFSIPVDFSKSPDQWFTPVNSPTIEEGLKKGKVLYIIDHKMATEKHDVRNCLQPGITGKRFFWWKNVILPGAFVLPSPEASSKIPIRLRLFFSDITSLPSFSPKVFEGVTGSSGGLDPSILCREACRAYPAREMEVPFDCEIENMTFEEYDPSLLFSISTGARSGTVVMTLVSGDILVLRFGHP